jgi:hypothetical protein
VERQQIYAHHEGEEEWELIPYRHSLWIEDGGPVGDVSASEDFYNVIQYGDLLESAAGALDTYTDTVTPKGHVILSDSGHKLSAYVDLQGLAAEPEAGNVIDLGLKIRAGHTGFHGVKYDVGAERQICRNGMMAFVSDLQFEQTHQDPLDYGLTRSAVDAIVDGVDVVEDRLERAHERAFISEDEAVLVLLNHGLDAYFDEPAIVLRDSLREELDTRHDQPTLYETYNAATRAITHGAELSMDQREAALERAARLLDLHGSVPEPEELGRYAVERRVEQHAADEAESYWDEEVETLRTLIEAHGEAAEGSR